MDELTLVDAHTAVGSKDTCIHEIVDNMHA